MKDCVVLRMELNIMALKPGISVRKRSVSLWLIHWLLASPGNQQRWCWLCSMNYSLYSGGYDLNNMCDFIVEKDTNATISVTFPHHNSTRRELAANEIMDMGRYLWHWYIGLKLQQSTETNPGMVQQSSTINDKCGNIKMRLVYWLCYVTYHFRRVTYTGVNHNYHIRIFPSISHMQYHALILF